MSGFNVDKSKKKPQILAPAGGSQSVLAAVRCGADGVYIGGNNFSARAAAENFTEEGLFRAAEYCHLHGVKIYRAMNTVIFDRELEEFLRQVKITAKAGFDGIIIQDLGGFALAKAAVPGMPLHASTQMTVHTPLGAKEAFKIGFSRIVPARELSLENIREICREAKKAGGEVEVFVHGAQCMCLSGQCYMSGVIGSRSANRGRCAQSCRLPVSACGDCSRGGERYDLSLKDMSLIGHAGELSDAGVDSFKIEGRMKRPEYTAAAVTALRHALYGKSYGYSVSETADLSEDMRRLKAVFSRSGFTDGYLTGKIGGEMFGSRTKEDVTAAGEVLGGLSSLYKDEIKDGCMNFTLTVKPGEPVRLDFHCENARGGEVCGVVYGDIPEKALRREFTAEDGEKNLLKLGGTRYVPGKVTCNISPGLALPAAAVNELRRKACGEADKLTVSANTSVYEINEEFTVTVSKAVPRNFKGLNAPKMKYRIISDSIKRACALIEREEVGYAILPVTECIKADEGFRGLSKIIVSLPDFVNDEKRLSKDLMTLREKGFTHFLCGNFTHSGVLNGLKTLGNIHIHGGFGMNITNRSSLDELCRMGFEDACLSFELKMGQTASLAENSPIPVGVYIYGRLPLMTARNCPIKAAAGNRGCRECTHMLKDGSGRIFPVRCFGEYVRILNCDILQVFDKTEDMGGVSFGILDLCGIDICEAEKVLDSCIRRESPKGRYTRGLYYRGIH
ncbi:MAG: DUF3656 domain-containing protein [Ruminococcus sp.]|nr:DUF3656 domain-containing protein [Ruminococcus sp.]